MENIKYCCNFYLDGLEDSEEQANIIGHWLTELTPMMHERHLVYDGADEDRQRIMAGRIDQCTTNDSNDVDELLDWVSELQGKLAEAQRELDFYKTELDFYKRIYDSEVKSHNKILESFNMVLKYFNQ